MKTQQGNSEKEQTLKRCSAIRGKPQHTAYPNHVALRTEEAAAKVETPQFGLTTLTGIFKRDLEL